MCYKQKKNTLIRESSVVLSLFFPFWENLFLFSHVISHLYNDMYIYSWQHVQKTLNMKTKRRKLRTKHDKNSHPFLRNSFARVKIIGFCFWFLVWRESSWSNAINIVYTNFRNYTRKWVKISNSRNRLLKRSLFVYILK